jgi:predicted hotdog family 3-hydroxylacyl-ACP dehydratase/3-hydroxymyristoyl/3-hydroxydecanoyl-(acyl carrier protein) dehydratase
VSDPVPDPDWEDVERTGDRLRARAVVSPDLAWLEGHFPGHPLVAGFVQLDWVLGLAREGLGLADAPEAIEALKFRSPLQPGTRFEIRLEAGSERLRFEIVSPRGEVFASGRVRWGTPPRQHAAASSSEGAGSKSPVSGGLPLRLPQTGRMRLLERVVAHDPSATTSEAVVREDTPLCRGGRVPSWLALEWLAQGMAAHGGLLGGAVPARGLLLGARRLLLRTASFGVGERLWVRAAPLRAGTGLVAFDCALGCDAVPQDAGEAQARALACASLNAFVESVHPSPGAD